jgi:hypothetical protein
MATIGKLPFMQSTLSTASGRSVRDVALVAREARRLVGLDPQRRPLPGRLALKAR